MKATPRKTRFAVLTLALTGFVAACLTGASATVDAQGSGVKGQVLMGPVVPGPITGEEPPDRPFSATFHVLDAEDNEVGQFQSDEEGKFQILLPPGDYTIVPDKTAPMPTPELQRKPVSVPHGEITEVKLRFDSGMR